ncbi:uncharacterized protein DS421_11g336880 [Arachis hypogaea]|nr:uncharacterized protein DS421_11g336880 [Arachis hypogaea]
MDGGDKALSSSNPGSATALSVDLFLPQTWLRQQRRHPTPRRRPLLLLPLLSVCEFK